MPAISQDPKSDRPLKGTDTNLVFFSHSGNTRLEKMASASHKKMSNELNDEFKMLDRQRSKYQRTHSKEIDNIRQQHKALLSSSGNFNQMIPKISVDDSFAQAANGRLHQRPRKSTPRPKPLGDEDAEDLQSDNATDGEYSDLCEHPLNTKDFLCPPKPHRHRRSRTFPEKDLRKSSVRPRPNVDDSKLPFLIRKKSSNSDGDLTNNSSCINEESPPANDDPISQRTKNRRLSLPNVGTGRPLVRFCETATVVGNDDKLSVQRIRSGRRSSLPGGKITRLLARQSLENSLDNGSNEKVTYADEEIDDEESQKAFSARRGAQRSMSIGYLPSLSLRVPKDDIRRKSLEDIHEGVSVHEGVNVVNLELNLRPTLQSNNLGPDKASKRK